MARASACRPSRSSGPAGLVVYLGIWPPAEAPDAAGLARGRVVALDARSGVVRAVAQVAGPPGHLALAPGRSPPDARLYCVEHVAFLAYDTSIGVRSRLLALDPGTLQLERELPLRNSPRHIAVAPDGERAYALTAGGRRLVQVDLASGIEAPARVAPRGGLRPRPGRGVGLRLEPKGGAIWVVDRRRGTVAKMVRVGQRPTELALGSHT